MARIVDVILVIALGLLLATAAGWAEEGAKMSEQEVLVGADARIERLRKADAEVMVRDGAGKPVAGARVEVEQLRHDFLFGCNAFPVLNTPDPKKEETFEREFSALFNYATLGFYWGAYEPEPGRTIAGHLKRQARWCREHGIAVKGHPLVWHEVYPSWGPSEAEETRARLRGCVTDIVSGFADLVDRWDVVNEATVSADCDNGVGHWARRDGAAAMVGEVLGWARAANPKALLVYNDFNVGPDYEKLAADLIEAGRPFDALGIQSHMHRGEWPISQVWQVCETYQRFGKPLHFTETTVLSGEHGWERALPWPTTPEGEARQADYVGKLYTVLFSHPAVQAITWWDFADGEWQGTPAGLVRADLTPKPAYERLLGLVKGKWWTRTEARTDSDGRARFRGYLGRYQIKVTTPSGTATQQMELRREAENAVTVVVR